MAGGGRVSDDDLERWRGRQEAKLENVTGRVGRLEKGVGGAILGLAALYLRSVGILP